MNNKEVPTDQEQPNTEKPFYVKCNVCKQVLENWVGSTPCCGSIAFVCNEDGSDISNQEQPNTVEKKEPEIFRFLLGETDIDGLYFGEKKDGVPFWWRGILRKEIEGYKSNQSQLDELEKWVKEQLIVWKGVESSKKSFMSYYNRGKKEMCEDLLNKIQQLKNK